MKKNKHNTEINWGEELEKCTNDPMYFYYNYFLVDSKTPEKRDVDAGILPNSPESVKRMIFGGSDDMININTKWEESHPDNVKEVPFIPVFYSQGDINKIKKAQKDLDE